MSLALPSEILLNHRSGAQRVFTLMRCRTDHLEVIERLQDRVLTCMHDSSLFVPETREELMESLESDYCLGAFFEGELAMFTLMITNRPTERNLGHALGWSDDYLKKVVTYDSTFVAPEFRGYGLQRLSYPYKKAEALRLDAKEALASVAPENSHSLNNLLSQGFDILDRRLLYGGRDRFILIKHLGKERLL